MVCILVGEFEKVKSISRTMRLPRKEIGGPPSMKSKTAKGMVLHLQVWNLFHCQLIKFKGIVSSYSELGQS